MANTKVTQHVIANNAITADQLASAAVTDAKLHSTLDLSSKTLTLPATAIPSASTATTQAASDNSTKLATTAYVTTAIGNLNDSAPTALNTLNELAAALGDDANFSATITTSLASKLPLAGGTLTGDLVLSGAPTSGLHPATKTYTDTADALKLNLSGGTLTGDLILNTTTALKIPAGTTGQRPSASTGQIRWNTTDGALEVYNGSAWTAVGTGSSNKVLDTFTGDNSTTTFTLSITPANEDAIMVFIDGAYQEKGDYVLTNNSLALGTAPLSGEKIAVHTTTASVHDGTTALNQAFTGDGSTTDFTLSQDPKSENNTQIYINGVYQQKTDYTVTGTTLAFDTAPDTGDIIEVNMFTVATLGNTDTVNEGVSNLYHTTARARSAISVSGNALSYNSSTGVITSAYEESPSFTGSVDVAGNITVGTNDTILAENNIRFKPTGAAYIDHNTVGQDINFRTSVSSSLDTAALTILASGHVLIGKTNSGFSVAGIGLRGDVADFIRSENSAINVNRLSNNGDQIRFHQAGALIGAIGSEGGDSLYIQSDGTGGGGLRFHNNGGITPLRNGATVHNAIDLGTSTRAFKDFYTAGLASVGHVVPNTAGTYAVNHLGVYSGGITVNAATSQTGWIMSAGSGVMSWGPSGGSIKLGGLAAANTLDSYEEGNWNPVIGGDGANSGTQTYTGTRYGKYVKIGRLVTLYFDVQVTALGTTTGTYATIKNFPFNVQQSHMGGGTFNYYSSLTGITEPLNCYVGSSETGYLMRGGASYVLRTALTANTRLMGQVSYYTNE